uniref:Interleukin 34 n=1 Tax=Anser brachyrhynchus TaxID=132585 RepID=A0A8B9BDR3_9AVES
MHQGYAAVLCVLAVLRLEAAALGECELARLLQDQLRYEKRLQYTKHYFPIGYTLRVQYEEVLRPANITRLVRPPWGQSGDEARVEAAAVVAVGWWLGCAAPWGTPGQCSPPDPLRPPNRDVSPQSDVAAAVAELVQRLHSGERRPKAVRPKALLDNCLRVLRMLFGAPCEWGRGFGGGPGC